MIKLYQFAPAFGLPNASPFCMKVETYLRMAGLPYECPRGASHFKAPKGKLPYIDDNGKLVSDSSFIIDYLKATYGDKLDAALTAEQAATARAYQKLLEEDLYWAVLYTRWIDAAGFTFVRNEFFARLAPPLRWILPHLARRGLRRQMHAQGMGRHSRDEIMQIGCRDVAALAVFLGAKPYISGGQPTSFDAGSYAFLANIVWAPPDNPIRQEALKHANLVAYCERMKARYYGN